MGTEELKESEAQGVELIQSIANWIDPYVIAENIVEHFEENDEEPTMEKAQALWYRALEMLGEWISEQE